MEDDNYTRRKDVANNVRLEIENLELKVEVRGEENIIQLLREEVKTFQESRQTTVTSLQGNMLFEKKEYKSFLAQS